MPVHSRTLILNALAAAVTGLASGAQVFTNALYPLTASQLPALRLTDGDEESEVSDIGGALLARRLTLEIEIVLTAAGALTPQTLNDIAAEIEIAVAAAGTLGGKVKDISLTGISRPQVDNNGESPTLRATMTYQADYWTARNAPQTPL